jgi:hypothetical protein
MFAAQDDYWAAVLQTFEGFKAKVATFIRLECRDDYGLTADGLKSFLGTLCRSVEIIAA